MSFGSCLVFLVKAMAETYIIMCGSNHGYINGVPRQLVEIQGERVLDRTIRLLRENGVENIIVTATDLHFFDIDASVVCYDSSGPWVNCFLLDGVKAPVTYIFGDVYFSEEAIKKIVTTETDSIEFFASAPPFGKGYIKQWGEPFAFKVKDFRYFSDCIKKVKEIREKGMWKREPIAWEVWQVIKQTPINQIDYGNYTIINDYTCDIDRPEDLIRMGRMLKDDRR